MKEPEIYCPQCKWRPQPESRWICRPVCGTVWNTFWTGGLCPGCGFAWQWTVCLACDKLSPHKDWYHFPEHGEPANTEKEQLPEQAAVDQR